MGFKCGIVGLPNVGKSTLFNALTATAAAQAANFPFCTIEPNVGRVAVPDERMDRIASVAGSKVILPTQLEFVDIAGLVRGASKGEGLGNQFLANIREVDAIIHVLRCFENDDITHVEGSVDPIRDADIIETELMLADMDSLDRRLKNIVKKSRGGDKDAQLQQELMERALKCLEAGEPARMVELKDAEERKQFKGLQLLTSKPILYVCNVNEDDAASGNEWTDQVKINAETEGAQSVVICAAIESEIAQLSDPAEKKEFIEAIGLDEPGLNKVIRAGYRLLDLITFFTAGPKECRAWTVRRNSKAPQAAGEIHTDFERGFISAETVDTDTYVELGGEQPVRDSGKMRREGKEYVVQDGDIILFRFNV